MPTFRPDAAHTPTPFPRIASPEALLDGDCEAVMEIYSAQLRVLNRSHAAAKLHVSRQHVHRMMSSANPRLDTFARFTGLLKTEVVAAKA